jgi:imidazolonepropionase-like amidohydrolase
MTTRITILLVGAVGAGIMAAGIALDRPPDAPVKTRIAAAPRGNRTALLHVRVFDGERMLPDATVVIDGDHIAALGPGIAAPAGADLIDGAGKTLLPGLIDAHAHASGDALERALVFGVTTELDMFADPAFAARARAEQSSHRVATRADLRSAGVLVTAPGGHGTEFGQSIPTLAGAGDARAFVDARIAEGSDYIKIVKDDGSAYGITWPTLDNEELAAVVAAAHWRQKLAVVHIGTQADAVSAIDAGADGLVHLFADSAPAADFAARVAKHRAFVVPTLGVLESETGRPSGASLAADPQVAPQLTEAEAQGLKSAFQFPGRLKTLSLDHARATVAALKAAGVPILAGTDAPNPGTAHGASLHRELELLVSAGLTPLEALAAATSTPARLFGLLDRGRIAPGLRADLVLVDGEPDLDIRATRAIARVWRNGVLVAR